MMTRDMEETRLKQNLAVGINSSEHLVCSQFSSTVTKQLSQSPPEKVYLAHILEVSVHG
jgi:hypothetical protein